MARLLTLWRWFLARWLSHTPAIQPETVGALALAPQPEPQPPAELSPPCAEAEDTRLEAEDERRVRRARGQDPDDAGLWHFRSTILDRLDEYFGCIRRLRRHDPDAYRLFARLGFAVPADCYANPESTINLTIGPDVERPTFGGILCGGLQELDKRRPDSICPVFIYFTKLRLPRRVEYRTGDVYRLTCVYDDRRRARQWRSTITAVGECHIVVHGDGRTELLREHVGSQAVVVARRGRRREKIHLTQHHWQYPAWLVECCADAGYEPVAWAEGMFRMALLTHQIATSRIVVRARQRGCVAAFGIDVTRAKYFFRDREIDLACDGKRKRIFHSVASHDRQIATGRTARVRSHYRGARHFIWNAYQVGIVLPRHNPILMFNQPGVEDVPAKEQREYYDSADVGKRFDKALSA